MIACLLVGICNNSGIPTGFLTIGTRASIRVSRLAMKITGFDVSHSCFAAENYHEVARISYRSQIPHYPRNWVATIE